MKQILLVEDNQDIMCINGKALNMCGYDIVKAFTLCEAEKCIASNMPDMILMEAVLPDGNGLDFCKKIKSKSDIPILFLSGLRKNSDIVAGLRAGGDDYITKPYNLDELLARIKAKLN